MQGTLTVTPAPPYGDTPAFIYNLQPDLSFALPNGTTDGAVDQTVRLIIKPDLWGRVIRLRFSNFFGTRPVTFSKVAVGLQAYAANLVRGTNTDVTFCGKSNVTIQPGDRLFSDPVVLCFVKGGDEDRDDNVTTGRREHRYQSPSDRSGRSGSLRP